MKAVVVYESMFGNTKIIARAIARAVAEASDVELICVTAGAPQLSGDVDLLVVGGPTHILNMSRPSTRHSAPETASKSNSGLTVEPGADTAIGVREWLAELPALTVDAAAFDTRIKGPSFLTGRASRAIAKGLKDHGARLVVPPESFLVNRRTQLIPGEEARAEVWARGVAQAVAGRANAND